MKLQVPCQQLDPGFLVVHRGQWAGHGPLVGSHMLMCTVFSVWGLCTFFCLPALQLGDIPIALAIPGCTGSPSPTSQDLWCWGPCHAQYCRLSYGSHLPGVCGTLLGLGLHFPELPHALVLSSIFYLETVDTCSLCCFLNLVESSIHLLNVFCLPFFHPLDTVAGVSPPPSLPPLTLTQFFLLCRFAFKPT